jgi:hypothetical protein
MLLLAGCAGSLLAAGPVNATLAFTPGAGGTVVSTLSGSIAYCTIGISGPSVATVGKQVNIVTPYLIGECPAPQPGVIHPPTPFSVPVNLGTLPDGHYNVTWTFVGPGSPILGATSSFTIASGALIGNVPLFTPGVDAMLGVLLCVVAVVAMRR